MISSTLRAWTSLSVARIPGLSIWKQPIVRPWLTIWLTAGSFSGMVSRISVSDGSSWVQVRLVRFSLAMALSHVAQYGQTADAQQVDLDQSQAFDRIPGRTG